MGAMTLEDALSTVAWDTKRPEAFAIIREHLLAFTAELATAKVERDAAVERCEALKAESEVCRCAPGGIHCDRKRAALAAVEREAPHA